LDAILDPAHYSKKGARLTFIGTAQTGPILQILFQLELECQINFSLFAALSDDVLTER
jgi:hypothetical protein